MRQWEDDVMQDGNTQVKRQSILYNFNLGSNVEINIYCDDVGTVKTGAFFAAVKVVAKEGHCSFAVELLKLLRSVD